MGAIKNENGTKKKMERAKNGRGEKGKKNTEKTDAMEWVHEETYEKIKEWKQVSCKKKGSVCGINKKWEN